MKTGESPTDVTVIVQPSSDSSSQAGGRTWIRGRNLVLPGIVLLAALGAFLVLYATAHGVGTSPDSVVYLGVARNLSEGRGLTEPFGKEVDTALTRFPPLYPILLTTAGTLGGDPEAVARWLNALVFGASILFVGVALHLTLSGSTWLPIVGSLLVLTAVPLLSMHAMAWSEPQFLLLGFLALFLLARFLDGAKGFLWVLAALMIGLALLTRYAAMAFLATGMLGIVLFSRQRAARRLVQMVVFGALGALPTLLWIFRNLAEAGTAAGRTVGFHPVNKSHAWQALYTISGWLHVPDMAPDAFRFGLWLLVALAVLAIVLVILRSRTATKDTGRRIPSFIKLLLLFIPIYGAFLLVSISLLDANTPLDDRILSPIYVAAIFLVIYGADRVLRAVADPRPWRIGLSAVLVLFVGASVVRDTSWIRDSHSQGLGFSSLAWQRSETIQQVRLLPQDVLVYSNAPEAIYLHLERRALPFPKRTKAATRSVNEQYPTELSQMMKQIREDGAVVAYFRGLEQPNLPTEAELRQQHSLRLLAQTADGAMYGANIVR